MRPIKYRAWDKTNNRMIPWEQLRNTTLNIFEEDWCEMLEFTGLHDRDGKEIYEGDILECRMGTYTSSGVMTWNEKEARWAVFHPIHKFKVIGNIYENPELLEAE